MQSLERAIKVLKTVAYAKNGMSLTEVAKVSGLSASTTHRIVNVLLDHKMLAHSPQRTFTPGSELFCMGREAGRYFNVATIALPHMTALAASTGDTVFLTIMEADDSVCIERVVGNFPIKVLTLDVGVRRPLGVGAASQALFAALADTEIKRIIKDDDERRRAQYPRVTPSVLAQTVQRVREVGYAVSYGLVVPGMGAVSMCIRRENGPPVAAISISAIRERLEGERLAWVVEELRKTTSEISKSLP